MSHIERKKIKGRYYLYRYQSYRDEGGRVRKRFIQYLGPLSPSSRLNHDLEERRTKNGKT
ncbi:MAG: hypothetical protein U9Q22_06540 [Candidatus Altiarchaeota archaeon]|nr:hypothetical protein [Candidatus Altiarchaeota archaeon]